MAMVNQMQLRELTGKGRSAIIRSLSAMQFEVGPNGSKMYPSEEALQRIYLAGPEGLVLNPQQEKAQLDREKRLAQEMTNQKLRGSLLTVEEVEEAWGRVIGTMKSRLSVLPSRVVPELMQSTDRVQAERFLLEQIYAALTKASDEIDPTDPLNSAGQ